MSETEKRGMRVSTGTVYLGRRGSDTTLDMPSYLFTEVFDT